MIFAIRRLAGDVLTQRSALRKPFTPPRTSICREARQTKFRHGGVMGLFSHTRKPAESRTVVPWEMLGITYRPTIRGESHYQPELRRLLRRSVNWTALMRREADNKFDANAVSIWIDGQRVAYLARQEAAELAPRLDELAREGCAVAIEVTLCGGDQDRPSIGVFAD